MLRIMLTLIISSKGRPDWWKEPDLKDDLVRSGKMRFVHARYREEDPDWYDPKVFCNAFLF